MKPALSPIIPSARKADHWLREGLLPREQIVLLDGSSGVGKSILAARFAADHCAAHSENKVLYITSDHQAEDRTEHLYSQQTDALI